MNTIQLNLLENKTIVAMWNSQAIAYEGGYRIIAGEIDATEFEIVSVPDKYKDATISIECVNALKKQVQAPQIKNNKFTLPVGMAVAGYGQITFKLSIGNEIAIWTPLKIKVWNTDPNWQSKVIVSAPIIIGATTTLPAGSQATVKNVGTAENPVLDFGIPQGKGVPGQQGEQGISITYVEVTPSRTTATGNIYDVNIELSNGQNIFAGDFEAPKGEDGADGQSITEIENVDDRQYGDYTITTLRPMIGNTALPTFELRAKNGEGFNASGAYPNMTAGNAFQTPFGTCETGADIADKEVSVSDFVLKIGARITVWFAFANNAESPTLNVNGTGAKRITADEDITYVKWRANPVMEFVYTGGWWRCIGGYPLQGMRVSKYYISDDSTSPAQLYGGSWEEIKGRFLYANAGNGTGGSNTHSLTAEENGRHYHTIYGAGSVINDAISGFLGSGQALPLVAANDGGSFQYFAAPISHTNNIIEWSGSGTPFSTMPAYQEVYAWRRTA